MAVGTTQYLNNSWLNTIKSTGTSFNVAASIGVLLHTANPVAGAAAVSANTTRQPIAFTAATTGSLASNTTPSWTSWPAAGNNESIGFISLWDSTSAGAGTCLWTAQLTTAKTVNTGDTFTLSSATLTITNAS